MDRDGRWLNRNPARSNQLRSGSYWRTCRGRFQPRLVWVGPWRETWSKEPGLLEVARYLQAALLGRAVGYSVRAFGKERLDASVPLWFLVRLGTVAGAVSDLPADGR